MKRLTAAVLALTLMMAVTSALALVRKTELVYAKLSATGGLLDTYIVNAFEADEAAEIKDYGSYSELINLSGTDALKREGEATLLSLSPGRSYYQGKPDKQQLPWRFAISYVLDGKPVTPEALSGAQGKLEMDLAIEVVPELAAFARSSTLQITLSLDGDRCLNIVADKATEAYAGGNVTLAFVVLPGQAAHYTITADVRDFAMPGLQIAGLRMGVDVDQYKVAIEGGMAGNPMAQALGPMVENFVSGMSGQSPHSFADSRNGELAGLQFIILAEGIAEKPKEITEAPQEDESAAETVFTRLLALFID